MSYNNFTKETGPTQKQTDSYCDVHIKRLLERMENTS